MADLQRSADCKRAAMPCLNLSAYQLPFYSCEKELIRSPLGILEENNCCWGCWWGGPEESGGEGGNRVVNSTMLLPMIICNIQSPSKVLEQHDQLFCFCYTLKTIEFEVRRCTWDNRFEFSAFVSWYFYLDLWNNVGHITFSIRPPNV